jgi:hypothetical protein
VKKDPLAHKFLAFKMRIDSKWICGVEEVEDVKSQSQITTINRKHLFQPHVHNIFDPASGSNRGKNWCVEIDPVILQRRR